LDLTLNILIKACDQSKFMVGNVLSDFAKVSEFNCVVFLHFTAAGANESGEKVKSIILKLI
jgi:UDP-glucose 4-epimerase